MLSASGDNLASRPRERRLLGRPTSCAPMFAQTRLTINDGVFRGTGGPSNRTALADRLNDLRSRTGKPDRRTAS